MPEPSPLVAPNLLYGAYLCGVRAPWRLEEVPSVRHFLSGAVLAICWPNAGIMRLTCLVHRNGEA